MARKTGRSRTALSEAAGGDHLPTWETVEAFVRGCGGDPVQWLDRWERARDEIQLSRSERPLPIADTPIEPDEGPAPTQEDGVPGRRSRLWPWLLGLIIAVVGVSTVMKLGIFEPTDSGSAKDRQAAAEVTDYPVALIANDATTEPRVASITAVIHLAPSATYTYWLVLKVHDPGAPTSSQYYARARLPSTPQRARIVLRFPLDSDTSSVRLARIYEVPTEIDKQFEAKVKLPFDRQTPAGSPPCLSCISSNEIEVRFVG